MRLNNTKYLYFIILLMFLVTYSSSAYAISKLDFFKLPESISNQVQAMLNSSTDKADTTTEDATTKQKGDKAEGKALWKTMKGKVSDGLGNIDLMGVAKSVISGKGFDFKSLSSQFMNGAGLNDLSLDIENMANLYNDYQQEVIKVRAAKRQELMQKKADLEAMYIAEKDEARKDEIRKSIDVLGAEIKYNQAKLDENEAQNRQRLDRIEEARRAISQAHNYLDTAAIDEEVSKKIDSLFKEEEEADSQNEILYGKSINDFFLGKFEYENSKNVARINKNRDTEHYKSFQKALKSVMETKVYDTNVEDQANACSEISTGVDTIHGAMSMRICEDIQTAKTASMFTKMLLSEIKLDTTAEMANWNDKFKLNDYGKDITRFNMDDYVLSNKDLLTDKVDDLLNKGAKKIDEFSF